MKKLFRKLTEKKEESYFLQKSREELIKAKWFDKDGAYSGKVGEAVMELIKVFDKQNHSGMSAKVVANVFMRLVDHEPLTALTGADDEWNKSYFGSFQNKRCTSVFKSESGRITYNEALVFVEPNGVSFTGACMGLDGKPVSSSQEIVMPFVPKTFFIDVTRRGENNVVVDQKQLDEALKYFATPAEEEK